MKKIIMLMLLMLSLLVSCDYNGVNVDSAMLIFDLTDYPDIVGEKIRLEGIHFYQADNVLIGEYLLETKTNIYWTLNYLSIKYDSEEKVLPYFLNVSFKNTDDLVSNEQKITLLLPIPEKDGQPCYFKKEIPIQYNDYTIPVTLVLNYYGMAIY